MADYHSGGIIQVTNSTFRDCETAADFAPYSSYSGSVLLPDVSYFYNVTFSIDSDYKGSMIPAVAAQVHLQEVNGVQFGTCKFLNRTNRYVGDGIRAENAGFSVHPYCISAGAPCVTPQRSSFNGFVNGVSIKQTEIYLAPVATIDRTDFDSVSVGVNVAGQNNVSVTRSTFKIGRGPTVAVIPPANSLTSCGRNVGILMQNAQVFKMEDNDFKGRSNIVPMTPWYNIGTIVANSKATNSKVYRGTYDSLTAGVLAIGNNFFDKPPYGIGIGDGLRILCNSFSNNEKDIVVTGNDAAVADDGIAEYQGSLSVPAGNLFYSSSTGNIYNYTPRMIRYYYDAGGLAEEYPAYNSGLVAINVSAAGRSCVSGIPDPVAPPVLTTGGLPGTLRVVHNTHGGLKDMLSTAQGEYVSLMDLGNAGLKAWVKGEAVYSVTDSMLTAGSPYLSEGVLKALVDKWCKTQRAAVLTILAANPDVMRDLSFVAYLTDIMELDTDEQATLTSAGQNAATDRTDKEAAIRQMREQMADAANQLILGYATQADTGIANGDTTWAMICMDSNSVYYLLDSNVVYWGLDSLDGMLRDIGGAWTDYARAGYYVYKKEYDVADSILGGVNDYIGNEGDLAMDEYTSYTDLWSVQKNAYDNGRSMYELNADDFAALDTTGTNAPTPYGGIRIKLNLKKVETFEYPCAYPPPVFGKAGNTQAHANSGPIKEIEELTTKPSKLSIYPNPTKGTFTLVSGDNGKLQVYTVDGRLVADYVTGKGKNELMLPKQLPAGVYMCRYTGDSGGVTMVRLVRSE